MYTNWQAIHEDFLKKHYLQLKDKELCVALAKEFKFYTTVAAVRKKRQRLGLDKPCGRLAAPKVDID